ncbi:hypothetical protein D0T66_08425 [Dysgonomonas sp. 25]|nr:hypothetical protein [Dysgonomonas sp. 25]
MGPVGMLCVQRTLNDGRGHGLYTGLGAVIGDILLAFIAIAAAYGLGLSSDTIYRYEDEFQIFGSVILIVFGYIIFRRNPSKNLAKLKESKMSVWKVLVSAFILTVSNIGTLFLFMALFARFNIINLEKPFAFNILIMLMIGLGALLWWLLITYIVNKLRSRFNPRGLQVFNRIVGVILFVVGVIGIFDAVWS